MTSVPVAQEERETKTEKMQREMQRDTFDRLSQGDHSAQEERDEDREDAERCRERCREMDHKRGPRVSPHRLFGGVLFVFTPHTFKRCRTVARLVDGVS